MAKAINIIWIFLLLSGCKGSDAAGPAAAGTREEMPSTAASELPAATVPTVHTPTALAQTIEESPTATATPLPAPISDPTPTPEPTASATAAADRSLEVAVELAQAVPPARDDVRLAVAFAGLDAAALSTTVPQVAEPLTPGTRQTFKVLDVVNNTYGEIEAELLAVGDHAYFWFETEPYGAVPDQGTLSEVVPAFDDIYAAVTAVFGQENSPGIDGDPRLHVLHASPQTICGVSPDGEGSCGTAGFVSSADLQPAILNPQSNEREMFVMNDRQFGGDYYLGVLAHEFRHMIEFNYDVSDTDWEKEGAAVLASELVGLPSGGLARANNFLSNPDQQLNSWTEIGKGPYYGQGYLFNQYIYDRLGEDLYREFATSPLPGFVALDSIAQQYDRSFSGESLWLDWLVALVLHEDAQAEPEFQLNIEGLETANIMPIDVLPGELTTDVRQFAADYYELPPQTVTVQFAGEDTVPILAGQEITDEVFWYAQRANHSNPRLTRTIDLREAQTAALNYDIYADIEQGFDFAYVSVSADGGKTWDPLTATTMQGLDAADDPSGSALTSRFYTGRTQEWRHEVIDLKPYAGQEILLRFEMVTDPILTYSGLAVDNVAVPEIGFFDDDSGEGWTAEGFTLAPAALPQQWHLRLLTFPDAGPVVNKIALSPDGTAEFTVFYEAGQQRPILIVAAAAPMTLEPATYNLLLNE